MRPPLAASLVLGEMKTVKRIIPGITNKIKTFLISRLIGLTEEFTNYLAVSQILGASSNYRYNF